MSAVLFPSNIWIWLHQFVGPAIFCAWSSGLTPYATHPVTDVANNINATISDACFTALRRIFFIRLPLSARQGYVFFTLCNFLWLLQDFTIISKPITWLLQVYHHWYNMSIHTLADSILKVCPVMPKFQITRTQTTTWDHPMHLLS